MKLIPSLTTVVAVLIIGIVVAYGINRWSVARMTELKNQAFDECSKISTFSFEQQDGTGKTTRSEEPLKAVYKTCVDDKGYQTTITL